jgi:hypothetical protein
MIDMEGVHILDRREQALQLLTQERAGIDRAILALQAVTGEPRRGRPPVALKTLPTVEAIAATPAAPAAPVGTPPKATRKHRAVKKSSAAKGKRAAAPPAAPAEKAMTA